MKAYQRVLRTLMCVTAALLATQTSAAEPRVNAIAANAAILEKQIIGKKSGMRFLVRIPDAVAHDKSIGLDVEELVNESDSMLSGLRNRKGIQVDRLPSVQISWLKKGRTVASDAEQPVPEKDDGIYSDDITDGYESYAPRTSVRADSFSAYKPSSRNEFNLYIPVQIREILLREAETSGANSSHPGKEPAKSDQAVEKIKKEQSRLIPLGWSMNDDNRIRLGSLNTQINTWPWRTITHFSNTCSGTLIGPRHIVTAAHCINSAGTDNFFSFTVRTKRNGTAFSGQSTMPGCPNLNCPNIGKAYWYFTPSPWRQANTSNREQYDIGIIVIPDRLGDSVGWMGYWYAPISALNTVNKYSRGYPSCDAKVGNQPRIDDPADPLKCPTCTTDLTVCNANHLYGDAARCSIGNATNKDGSGYNRNFRMSCDGSAGMSGSPLYFYGNGSVGASNSVYYTAHDIQWTCGGLASSSSCANVTRADRLVRLTPEYASWISYFRNTFP